MATSSEKRDAPTQSASAASPRWRFGLVQTPKGQCVVYVTRHSVCCLLIALFAVTLYQPTVLSTGTINLAGEQPVAAVLILDTSPSMGYRAGGAGPSRLDDARRWALDFLDELPKNSRVAVVDPNDPIATWEPTPLEARNRIAGLKQPAGYAPPVTSTLAVAYQLLRTTDQDAGDQAGQLGDHALRVYRWQRATARASATSCGSGSFARPSSRATACCTCGFPARPLPVTRRLTFVEA